jgi:Na+/H+-translocating membrane pyrophosphatase
MGRGQRPGQRGQSLLVVLVFVAAFLLIIWAALTLAGDGFLGIGNVRADTTNTYALDAGLAYAIEIEHSTIKASACTDDLGKTFQLPYASGAITVTVSVTHAAACTGRNPSYTVNVTTSTSTRHLNGQISSSNRGRAGTWSVNWEAYQ